MVELEEAAMAGRKAIAITDRQFGALRVLWEHGPLTVRELREHLPRGDGQPYTTVLGLLQGMERAGLVGHEKSGRSHKYVPLVGRREATGSLISDFLARFFHGSAEQLVLGLVDAERLAPDDLKAIEARLEQAREPAENPDASTSSKAIPSKMRLRRGRKP